MNDSYLPPQPPAGLPVSNPHLPIGIPRSVMVFGVMHLVFGTIAVLYSVWGLVTAMMGDRFWQETTPSAESRAILSMEEKIQGVAIAGAGVSIVVGAVMILAGMKLVKGRRNG